MDENAVETPADVRRAQVLSDLELGGCRLELSVALLRNGADRVVNGL